MSSLNATFAVTCFLFRKESWPEWSLDLAWLPCWLNLRNVLLICQSSKSLSLLLHRRRANSFTAMPHSLLCSSNSGSSKQLCQIWSGAKIVVYSIVHNICKFDQGVLNFWERCSKRCPFPSVRRMIPSLVCWEEATLVLKFDVLHSWWVLIGIHLVVVLKLTVEQRTRGSPIGKVLQTFEITAQSKTTGNPWMVDLELTVFLEKKMEQTCTFACSQLQLFTSQAMLPTK